jgi:oligopeptide transport system ATP-binding protein
MYAGNIIEQAPVEEAYANPRHPYTLGLLGSIPRLDAVRKSKLTPIEGLPPDLIEMPDACPFNPRCAWVQDQCRQKKPELRTVAPNHQVSCWFDVERKK